MPQVLPVYCPSDGWGFFVMSQPRYLRFSRFKSEKGNTSQQEAQRLIKLRKEVKRLKRQRLIFTAGACITTGIIVYLMLR